MRGVLITLSLGVMLAAGCGEKVENHLALGLSTADRSVVVGFGTSQPCLADEDAGGLPNVSGYYYRIENLSFRWTSTTSTFVARDVTMTVTAPGAPEHVCSIDGEEFLRLFRFNGIVEPVTSTDVCGTGENAVPSCKEFNSRADGGCALVCGELPLSANFSNFVVPATIEMSGLNVSGEKSTKISTSTKVLVEFSK